MSRYDSWTGSTIENTDSRSPVRIMAGPGTGKTRRLMERVKQLLYGGADPKRILLVTFTRVAARDLQTKLEKLGAPGAGQVRAGTLHSFCLSTLNKAHVFDLTGRIARPLLEFEERFLLEDLQSPELGDYRARKRQLKAFEAAWAREQDQEPGWPSTAEDQAFARRLDSWLRFHHGMLLGEIVPRTLSYLRANPGCPERRMFDHVLVDEYQDLNRASRLS